ncbi:phenoloxidase-activating factor 3-like [Uranotaenia lowii]|uniref:phenoloxidase-activating factor 3-like n=1 Tax=Uranotaenia lowii TaxID=190385 RepID=UPI00247914BD|nr:phenoloxidase-activating factor 3-like [Uranotaenia lowii]
MRCLVVPMCFLLASVYCKDALDSALNSEGCGSATRYGSSLQRPANARLMEFPWLARLGYQQSPEDAIEYLFQGTLIHPLFVITTVFAAEYSRNSLKFVRLGDYNSTSDPDCDDSQCAPIPQDIPIELIIKHPNYNKPRLANDLVLLKLKNTANINSEHIGTACIPTGSSIAPIEEAPLFVVAWCGSRKAGISVIPRQYRMQKMSHVICAEKLKDHMSIDLHRSELCAALNLDKQTQIEDINLRGGTGAPVHTIGPDRKFYVVGMLSVGVRDAPLGMPYVLVDLREMSDWLETTVADQLNNVRFNRTGYLSMSVFGNFS